MTIPRAGILRLRALNINAMKKQRHGSPNEPVVARQAAQYPGEHRGGEVWAAPRRAARRTAGCSRHGAAARTAPRDSTRGSGPGLRTTARRTRTRVVLGRELLAVLDAPKGQAD